MKLDAIITGISSGNLLNQEQCQDAPKSMSELKEAGLTLAVVKYGLLEDHLGDSP
jgi:hypothetical protein